MVNFEEDLQLHFDIFRILGLENVEKEKCCIRLFFYIFESFGEVSLAKNLSKIEILPFLEPQNMKISPAKIHPLKQ